MSDDVNGAVNRVLSKLRKREAHIKKVVNKQFNKVKKEKQKKLSAYRKEASRLASMANKRIQRLEKNKLTDAPSYQSYVNGGGVKFSVKGKTHNELQAEVARLNRFVKSNTSTVRGAVNNLKEMARMTGFKYSDLQDLKKKSKTFFELAHKTEEYLRLVEDMGSAIGYQKIWETINEYTQMGEKNIDNDEADIDKMLATVTKAIIETEKPEFVDLSELGNGHGFWVKLKKE